ncbi:cytosolic protein [Bacillus mangrovi]|uniref:Cytosolic protein n=1 Tax=Metabacillus mangrovi TaxID=1491830 RepID=A0A7X2S5G6_9BACI|nr:cytosolic protein [Metabacillus mangrovi]MTH53870.1 cytosolic protein [Metabacillus mangrovi]
MARDEEEYHDFSNVEKMRNYVTPEITPEGPYGAPRGKDSPVENKSTPWHEGQRYYSAFNYENKNLHQELPRQHPGAHPPHDDPDRNEQ